MNLFETLQKKNLELIELTERTKSPDAQQLSEVENFVKEIREAGSLISDPKQRNQLRTLLLYWGAFIYDQKGEFPDTQLLPVNPELKKPLLDWWMRLSGTTQRFILLLIVLSITVVIISIPQCSVSSEPDVVVMVEEWSLRDAPNEKTSDVKEVLYKGTTLSIIGQAKGGYWLYVRNNANGEEGWIANRTDGVSVNVVISSIPLTITPTPKPRVELTKIVSSPTPTITPTPTSIPTDTPTPTPTDSPTPTPIDSPTLTPTNNPTPTPTYTPIPTNTPSPAPSTLYVAPIPIAPDNEWGSFGTFPALEWVWEEELEEDEYFEVRVWHEDITDYRPGLGWVKEHVFDYNISGEYHGKYYWTVVVVKDINVRHKVWYKPEDWPYPVWEHDPEVEEKTWQFMSLESEPRFFFFTPSKRNGNDQSPISAPCPPGSRSC